MGERGQVPKRSSERRRRNKESRPDKITVEGRVDIPAPDPEWHPAALAWYESLPQSGQSMFYEPSDWQAAWLVASELTYYLSTDSKRSAEKFKHLWGAMVDLMTTEASRRRVRVEVERDLEADETPAGVTAISDYRSRASA